MFTLYEATRTTQQEAYEALMDELLGEDVLTFTFGGMKLVFPTTYANSPLVIKKSSDDTTINSSWASNLSSLIRMQGVTGGYSASAYAIFDENYFCIASTLNGQYNILGFKFGNCTFLTGWGYFMPTNSSSMPEILFNRTTDSYITGSNQTPSQSIISTYCSGQQYGKIEQCIVIPFIYVGSFSDTPLIVNDFCILISSLPYPRGSVFAYNNANWETLGYNSNSSQLGGGMKSVFCHKLTN